jgi:hypothetical protein
MEATASCGLEQRAVIAGCAVVFASVFAITAPSSAAESKASAAAVEEYRSHRPARFVEPERRAVEEIVVVGLHHPSAFVAVLAHLRAGVVAAQLGAGVPFAAVARVLSQSASAPSGGKLGLRSVGELPSGLAAAAFKASRAEIVGPLAGPGGGLWWLRVNEVVAQSVLPVDEQRRRSAAIVAAMAAEEGRRRLIAAPADGGGRP